MPDKEIVNHTATLNEGGTVTFDTVEETDDPQPVTPLDVWAKVVNIKT